MTDVAKKALEMIKGENIHPKPRWQFLLKGYMVWVFAVVSVLLGSAAVSVAIFITNDYDLSVLANLDPGIYEHVISNLPYFWIVFILLFSLLAFYNLKHTKGGYRFRASLVLAGSVAASLIFGAILSYAGAGTRIDDAFARNFPFYGKMVCGRSEFWMSPESGFLAGEISKVDSQNDFKLIDLNNKKWSVTGDGIVWRHNLSASEGLKVRMIGKAGGDLFMAERVMPFAGMGQGRMMGGSCMMGGKGRE